MTDIKTNLQEIRRRIACAAQLYSRDEKTISLLAVSKTKPPAAILSAYEAGQRTFGENYVDEALNKIHVLRTLAIEWHFIGRIQSNKTAAIAENFSWVHGLCDLRHAERLARQRPPQLPALNVCIQVNLDDESSKAGISSQRLLALANGVRQLDGLHLRGLMTLPKPLANPAEQRLPFQQLRALMETINTHGFALNTLSMGMSDDMEAAIAEGATIVRIGSALFGQR